MAQIAQRLLALPAYAAVVAWLTWPLGAHLGTHLANTAFSCPFDPLLLGWALAHQSRVAFNAPAQLLDGNIFHPDPHALLYGETGLGALPYFLPTFLFTGNPTLALNLTFLGSITLTAWTLHLVAVRWTGSMLAGTVAAGSFLLTRWVLWSHVPCVPSYALLQYLPLIVLLSATVQRTWRSGALLATLLVVQGVSNAYLAVAVLVPLLLLVLARFFRRRTRPEATRSLTAILAAILILFVVYSGHLLLRRANPDLIAQTWWGMRMEGKLPFGPLSYMTPLGVPLVFPVVGILGTVAALRLRGREGARRRWAILWFWTIVGVLLSLSPVAWWHDTKITLPHLALPLWLGVYDVIRVPDRLGAVALIALGLLAGLGFAEITARLARCVGVGRIGLSVTRLACATAVLALGYFEYANGASDGMLSTVRAQGFKVRFPGAAVPFSPPPLFLYVGPLPITYSLQRAVAPTGPLLAALAASRGPLLEVPVGPGAGGAPLLQARAQYRSIFHGRALVNGYSGYYPRRFPARMALARRLPEPRALAQLRNETSLTSILVHLADLPPQERQRWLAAQVGRADLSLVLQDGSDLLFAVAANGATP